MKQSPAQRFKKNNLSVFVWILFIVGTLYLMGLLQNNGVARKELSYTEFYRVLTEEPSRLKVVTMSEDILQGEFVNGSRFFVNIPPDDKDLLALLRTHAPDFQVKPARTIWTNLLFSLGPVVLFIAFLWYFSYRGAEVGNRIWSFGKVKARLGTEPKEKVTFADVAGVDEAKEELQEVIEFLKDPKKFQRLGGKIPKGVLLVGPPGCGKTLIAKAVAGEANVPFFNISGSDFVEMFVGVGASRVRDLFEQARKAAKTFGRGAIIFIDEIDAVGRLRFSGIGGGHDEREQTLNQLLVEMDGFDPQEGIILIAATNRPDTLDPALLRPGRFDRHVVIDRPDIKGREAILKVHSANIKLAADVGLEAIARQTPGFSGADLANLCNEAALLAARYDKEAVGKKEMEAAIERVVAGPERKSRVISPKEKEIVAFHEAGHTLVSLLTPEVDPLHKVSIIPRGVAALGYTLQLPLQDRYIMMKSELIGRITVLLAGRASENLYFQDITTGSENDIEVATQMARRMVCEFGMSEKIGYLTLGHRQGLIFLGKNLSEERNYSDETAKIIDDEIKAIIDSCYDRARLLLEQNKDKLTLLANTLREREVMDAEEVKKLLGFAL
ncbi:ATP-dependent Zn proteases FtsH [Candidatus Velamenicoccus archaeovorus]|uniref:ATP-dependent zinc metalloprotease FtsH n=2 Tax=Velamenicoccus archaeovorus TaxID=1930593 RepID=A0A410P7B4_VELA1|nr:ATP-dependent Zn proteases FtsH [Candidatus Velamenicoccus archaeovorus]